jgi:hypothetical protein
MTKSIANTVRAAFALFLLGLSLYAGVDSLAARELASRGLSTCGSAENPCTLAPLTVTVAKPSGQMVNSTAADEGSAQTLGAAPRAVSAHQTAMAES